MGVFERHGWEKRWKFAAKKEKTAERKCGNRWNCKNIRPFFLEHGGIFSVKGNLNRCDGPFLLNEHGDLYFLLNKNIVHIILLTLEKKIKKLVGRKKRYSRKRAQNHYSNMQILTTKITTLRTLYVHVVLNCVICHQILYDIVLYAPLFLLVTFFPKCYFNNVSFELLQNLTWIDE